MASIASLVPRQRLAITADLPQANPSPLYDVQNESKKSTSRQRVEIPRDGQFVIRQTSTSVGPVSDSTVSFSRCLAIVQRTCSIISDPPQPNPSRPGSWRS